MNLKNNLNNKMITYFEVIVLYNKKNTKHAI